MFRIATVRTSRRFLGDSAEKKVHNLRNEDTRPSGCKIDAIIRSGTGVYFVPDSLKQAHIDGYLNCGKCLGSTRF